MKTLLSIVATGLFLLTASNSYSQSSPPPSGTECPGGLCGTPNQSGGGCGCGCGCSILIAMTDRGITYQFADDFDGDGYEDEFDNCPFADNVDQADADGDTVGDSCDVCAAMSNVDQLDLDSDGQGDACDADLDGDTFDNGVDNCPNTPNPSQTRTSLTGALGDACNDDDDGDTILDIDDPCRLVANDPSTLNLLGSGNCDDDPDGDGIFSDVDNCDDINNPDRDTLGAQLDLNGNGIGDACDPDKDGDTIPNSRDNCSGVMNPSQADLDHDGFGDNGVWGSEAGMESCDPEECYVVANQSGCLNPQASFNVRLGMLGLPKQILTGDDVVFQLFTNRLGELHNWTARFEKLPSDSDATLINAKGSATTLTGTPQLASCLRGASDGSCEEMNNIRFEPDEPGKYMITVTVNLNGGSDPKGLGSAIATATANVTVGGESAGGCAAGASSGLAALALGLLAITRRRRS